MRRRLLSRLSDVISASASPTADLYMSWSCQNLIDDGVVTRLAPTVYQAGRTIIVFRHDAHLRRYPDHDRLIYVIDDDWRAGLGDRWLPVEYRAKLLVEAEAARRIESVSTMIAVPSKSLFDLYSALFPGKGIVRIDPFWPAANDSLENDGGGFRIAVLGARSHHYSLKAVYPVLSRVLEERPNVSICLSGETRTPTELRRHPRVSFATGTRWPDYWEWLRLERFDLGLYPLEASPFNAARSLNKLMEYDQLGAAVIASNTWESAIEAERDGRCVMVNNNENSWLEAILGMVDAPGDTLAMARRNRAAIQARDVRSCQRAFWDEALSA